jgi:hypothetical protein
VDTSRPSLRTNWTRLPPPQSNDIWRCSNDAETVSNVHSLANEALIITIFVLVGLLAAVSVTIAVLNSAAPKYRLLNEN